jgi:hypothetical protein
VSEKDGAYVLNGFLNGSSARLKLSVEKARLEGWLDSNPVSLSLKVKNNDELRLAGRLGGGEPISVLVKRKSPTELRIGGFGRHGFVSLSVFSEKQPEIITGTLSNRSVRIELTREDDQISTRGYIVDDFYELSALTCLDSTLNYGPIPASELFVLVSLLAN